MCLLSAYRPDVPVDTSELINGTENNPDGSGFALLTPDRRLIIKRRMRGRVLVPVFAALRNKYPDSYAIFHSRIGTGGTLNLDNVHPFHIDNESVMAHNGIIWTVPSRETRCDSRIFAETKMRGEYRRWQKVGVRRQIEGFIRTQNKIAILSASPLKPPLVILNESEGITTDTGVWHSNWSYETYTRTWTGAGHYDRSWCRDCIVCDSIGSIEMDRCTICESCVTCGSVRCDTKQCAACNCSISGKVLDRITISATAELTGYECPTCGTQWMRLGRIWRSSSSDCNFSYGSQEKYCRTHDKTIPFGVWDCQFYTTE